MTHSTSNGFRDNGLIVAFGPSPTIVLVLGRHARRFRTHHAGALIPFSVAMVVGIALSGCTGSSSKNPESTETSTVPSASPVTVPGNLGQAPTVPPATSAPPTTVAVPKGLDTVEAASQNLWDAWRDDDRPRALLYATPAAVDALFLTRWGPELRNQGCGTANGVARCVYTLRRSARVVVMGQTSAGFFFAQRVETVGELPASNRLQSEIVDDTVVFERSTDATDAGTGSDGLGLDDLGTGLDPNQAATNAVDAPQTAPTVPGSVNPDPSSSGTRTTRRARPKTTKAKRKTTVPVIGGSSDAPVEVPSNPAPASPASPSPSPGPVQVAGQTVDTVAP